MKILRDGIKLAAVIVPLSVAACAPSAPPAPTLAGEPRLRLGQAAEESGDLGMAENMYAAASAAAPKDASIQLRYADVLVRSGKVGEAREVLARHLDTVSDQQQLRDGLGSIDVLAGEPARAIGEFDTGLAADPNDIRALVNKAVALDLLGHHGEAQTLYRRALILIPGDAVVVNNLALSMLLGGQAREAAEVVATLRNRSDVLPRIRASVGVVLAADGDLAGARAMIGSAESDEQLVGLARAASAAASR
jgi:Flp pilus assembly protein TadD